jgi:hypothetical protein
MTAFHPDHVSLESAILRLPSKNSNPSIGGLSMLRPLSIVSIGGNFGGRRNRKFNPTPFESEHAI